MPPTGSGSFGQSHPQPEGFLPFLLEDRFVPLLLGRRVEHRPGPVGFGVIHYISVSEQSFDGINIGGQIGLFAAKPLPAQDLPLGMSQYYSE